MKRVTENLNNKWFDIIRKSSYKDAFNEYTYKNSGLSTDLHDSLNGEIIRLVNQLSILGPEGVPSVSYSGSQLTINSDGLNSTPSIFIDHTDLGRLFMIYVLLRGFFECGTYDSIDGNELINRWSDQYTNL